MLANDPNPNAGKSKQAITGERTMEKHTEYLHEQEDYCQSFKDDGTCIHSDCMMKAGM